MSIVAQKPRNNNIYLLRAETTDAIAAIYGELQRTSQPITIFRIPAEQLRIVELASDSVCEACGLNSSPTCDRCPLERMMTRLEAL